jgi:hypothetical protein
MSRLHVDSCILARLLDWADTECVPDFRRDHARDGLFVAERYLDNKMTEDKEKLFLLALDVTFWFWMDDRVDENLLRSSIVDWDLLFRSLQGSAPVNATPEGKFLSRLGAELATRAESRIDHDWWLLSAAESLEGFREEEVAARGGPLPSLVEYLENGARSMPMSNILATASSLYSMNVATRRRDSNFAKLERCLCLFTRLENDLHGFEKERRERSPTNAVLLMEQFMPVERAMEFVLKQKHGYGMLLHSLLAAMTPGDQFVRFVRSTVAAHEEWYGQMPDRYSVLNE